MKKQPLKNFVIQQMRQCVLLLGLLNQVAILLLILVVFLLHINIFLTQEKEASQLLIIALFLTKLILQVLIFLIIVQLDHQAYPVNIMKKLDLILFAL